MARRESEPLQRIHVMLFESDVERLKLLYGHAGPGVSIAIRRMVRMALKRIEEKRAAEEKTIALQEGDVEL